MIMNGVISDLSVNTEYKIKVVAINENNNEKSSETNFKTPNVNILYDKGIEAINFTDYPESGSCEKKRIHFF